MDQLKSIKNCLVSEVEAQLNDIKHINTKELGEVVDMIKDLEEAMYYCSIIKAMEENKDEHKISYYSEYPRENNMKMYVPYMEYAPYMMRDDKWRNDHLYNGRSGMSRHTYVEGKMTHTSNDTQSMKELETYLKDLTDDVIDMIKDSTQEEKQVISNKLQTLASKVNK